MNDLHRDPEPETTQDIASSAEPTAPVDAPSDAPLDTAADRRAFMRQLSRDAVLTAGRLAGLSSIVRRSVVAAALEAGSSDVGSSHENTPGTASEPAPAVPGIPSTPIAPATPPPPPQPVSFTPAADDPPPAPAVAPDPVAALTPAQGDFLVGGASATLAVNDPSGAPHLTSSMYHWDGATLRLPAQLFTARATNIDRDPRVSLLIEDGTSGAWLAVTGVASTVYGAQADDELALLLSKYLEPDAAARHLEEMRASGDQMVIRIRPTRFVWRPA